MGEPVIIQERFGKIYICGAGDTEEEARENLDQIRQAMTENVPLLGAPVRPLGSRIEPKRIESITELDNPPRFRVKLEGEDFTRGWHELEYYV